MCGSDTMPALTPTPQHSTLTTTAQHSTLHPLGPYLAPGWGPRRRKLLRLGTAQCTWPNSCPRHPVATDLLCILGRVACVPPGGVAFVPENTAAPWGDGICRGRCGRRKAPQPTWPQNPGHITLPQPKGRSGLGNGHMLHPPWVGKSLPLGGKGPEGVKWR